MPVLKTEREADNCLNMYLYQISGDKLLSAEEEKRLSKRILKGDDDARRTLINSNLRLVVKIAKGYLTHDMELLDLIQEGNVGLIKAAEKFDFRKNVRFSTYASFWIRQSIARAISNKSRMIRFPHRKEEKLRKISKAQQKLTRELGRDPDLEELAGETKITEKDVRSILTLPNRVVSIESSNDSEIFSLKQVVDDPKYSPDYIVMRNYLKEKTRQILNILTEREKKVLLLRYSFLQGERYTLKEIGKKLEISPETVRQIEMRALRKIREHFSHLREFLVS
jgi:RNA polymerase primary sigma factor